MCVRSPPLPRRPPAPLFALPPFGGRAPRPRGTLSPPSPFGSAAAGRRCTRPLRVAVSGLRRQRRICVGPCGSPDVPAGGGGGAAPLACGCARVWSVWTPPPPPPPYAPFLTPLHAPDRRSAPVSGASPAGTVAAGSSLNRQPFYSDVCSEQTLNRRDIWSTLVRVHGSGSRVRARKRADLPRQAPLKAVVR